MSLLKGKKGLIMGVANERSIAWGIAKKLSEHGAELAFTYLGDSLKKRVVPLAESLKSNFTLSCDVEKKEDVIKVFNDIKKAATGSDVLFTDKVISMNDKVNKSKKLKDFKKFKITSKVMSYLKSSGIFLHCLPRGTEVSNGVFLSKQSNVWQQALNRIYVQKSILLYCFEKLR